MSKKYKAAIYLRISNTDVKSIESESLTNQRKMIEDFVQKNQDITIVSEFLDDGVTGLIYDRPAFTEMMKDIYTDKINCVIVKDLSRLGREYIETGTYLREIFPQYGVRFIAISDGVDTKNDNDLSGKLDVTLRTILNDAYSHDISKKTRAALETKRRNGEYTGSCPVYGYIRSDTQKNVLIPDPYTSEIVKDIFRMKKDGMSALRIAEKLNHDGVLSPLAYKRNRGLPTPKGGYGYKEDSLWSAVTVIRILKDETYTGTLIQGKKTTYSYKLKDIKINPRDKWNITQNAHEAIVTKSTFDLVQKLMEIDTRAAPDTDGVYLFSGMLICGCCGNRMTRKTVPYKDKKYYYYYCPTGKKNGCGAKMIKEDEIVGCVADSLKGYIQNIVELDSIIKMAGTSKLTEQVVNKFTTQLGDIQTQLDTITVFKTGLYESLVNGYLSKSEYSDLKKEYDAQLYRLNNAKSETEQKFEKERSSAENKLYFAEVFKEFAEMQSLSRAIVIQLISSITIKFSNPLKFHISYRYQSEYEKVQALFVPSVKEAI